MNVIPMYSKVCARILSAVNTEVSINSDRFRTVGLLQNDAIVCGVFAYLFVIIIFFKYCIKMKQFSF